MLVTLVMLGYSFSQVGEEFARSDGAVVTLLGRSEIAAELDLTPPQVWRIRELRRDSGRESAAFRRGLGKVDAAVNALATDTVKEIATRHDEMALSVLSPSQLRRFRQLFRQFKCHDEPFSFGLLNDKLADHLRLTDSQEARIGNTSKSFEDRFRVSFEAFEVERRLREIELKRDMLSLLTAEQRAEYERVFGEAFDFSIEPN